MDGSKKEGLNHLLMLLQVNETFDFCEVIFCNLQFVQNLKMGLAEMHVYVIIDVTSYMFKARPGNVMVLLHPKGPHWVNVGFYFPFWVLWNLHKNRNNFYNIDKTFDWQT